MDPKIAKHIVEVMEATFQFLEYWSTIDQKLSNAVYKLRKLEEYEGMETMSYMRQITYFRNQIELASQEARSIVEYYRDELERGDD